MKACIPHCMVLALGMLAFVPGAQAQEKWPARPIQLMGGFTAGGMLDTANRLVIPKLQEALGATIVANPVAGAGGVVATQKLLAAAPDGYTLMTQTTGTLFTRPVMYNIGYSHRDFTPIATFAMTITTIAARKDAPWNTLADFIRDAKANPKKYNYASTGLGGVQHLTMDILAQQTGIDVVHVPYPGGPQTIAALLGAQVQLVVSDLPHSELKYLATAHPRRASILPQVPTLKELGTDLELVVRWMVIGPKGLPRDIVTRMESAVRNAIADAETRKQLEARGIEVQFEGTQELERVWEREAAFFKERIESLGLAHYQPQKKQ